jgi:hypothetical protein
LGKLETEHELTGSKIPEYLDELKQNWPTLVPGYLKSDSLADVLFKADYSHVDESITSSEVSPDIDNGDEEEESCRFCDRAKTVKRKPRDMRVQSGPISQRHIRLKSWLYIIPPTYTKLLIFNLFFNIILSNLRI